MLKNLLLDLTFLYVGQLYIYNFKMFSMLFEFINKQCKPIASGRVPKIIAIFFTNNNTNYIFINKYKIKYLLILDLNFLMLF